jgi:hypothetical protein
MKVIKLAMTMTCAIALASWASPVVQAQMGGSTQQGSGQQREFDGDNHDSGQQGEFEDDHQDAGDAANDGKEGSKGDDGEHEVVEPPSVAGELTSSQDSDRVQDSQADSAEEVPDGDPTV